MGKNLLIKIDHRLCLLAFLNLMKDKFREEGEYQKTFPEAFPNEYNNVIFLKEDDRYYKEMKEEDRNKLEEVGHKYWEIYKSKGLSTAEIKKRQELYGKNKIPEKKNMIWTIRLLKEWTSLYSLLLWSASLLSFIVYAMDITNTSNVL